MKNLILLVFILICSASNAQQTKTRLPANFVYLKDYIPQIAVDLRYCGHSNFIGKPINGYNENVAIFTKSATVALAKVEKDLNSKNLGLKIFDAYRPQSAVNHFKAWALAINDTLNKSKYYPSVDKKNLFKDGYIASKSGHSRGSTIDLTIIDLHTKKELDMGTIFDFLGPQSAHSYNQLSAKQKENRALLKTIMEKHGFKPYAKEWWHYTFINEPYKKTYFNFPVQ